MNFKFELIHHRPLFQPRLTSFVVFFLFLFCRFTDYVGLERKNTVKMDPEG